MFYKLYDMLLSQKVYLVCHAGLRKSRRSKQGVLHYIQIRKVNFRDLKAVNLLENFTVVSLDRKDHGKEVQEVVLKDGEVILPDGRCALFRMWITSLKISGGPIENAQGPNINYKKNYKNFKM